MSEEVMVRGQKASLVRLEYASGSELIIDYEANLRHGETIIRTSECFHIGQILKLTINFPKLRMPIHLDGEVAWVDLTDSQGPAYGVEIYQNGEDWPKLASVIEKIKSQDISVIAKLLIRICVVDDNEHIALLINRGLKAHLERSALDISLEQDHLLDGVSALEHIQQTNPYNVILVDGDLPGIDGPDLVREIRKDHRYEHIPIILFSPQKDHRFEAKVLALGADIVLNKPIRLKALLDALKHFELPGFKDQ